MQNQPITTSSDLDTSTPDHVLDQIFTYEFNQNLFDYLDAEDSNNLSKILPLLYEIYQQRVKIRHQTYDNSFLEINPLEYEFIHKAIIYTEHIFRQPTNYIRHILSRPYLSELEIITDHINPIERLGIVERIFLLENADQLVSATNLSKLNKFTLQNRSFMRFHSPTSRSFTNTTIGFLLSRAKRLKVLRIKNIAINNQFVDQIRCPELHTLILKNVCVIHPQLKAITKLLLNHKDSLRTIHFCTSSRGANSCYLNNGYLIFRALNKLKKVESLHITYVPNLKLRNVFKLRHLKELTIHFNLDTTLSNIRNIYLFAKKLSKIHEGKIPIELIPHCNDNHHFNSFSPYTSLFTIRRLTHEHPTIHCQDLRD